jgi:hypothetical protein
MILSEYFNNVATGGFSFTRQQGSDFAKDIAGDFNPLHDREAKKFCVPGDLLFALTLFKLGVSQQMQFKFNGMISEDIPLDFAVNYASQISVQDQQEKQYLQISRQGDTSQNTEFATALAKSYVAFSGHTFPHVLVPLMAEKNVMINPTRPLVIYQSMSIDLQSLDFSEVELEITDTRLEVEGKRGSACLQFCFKNNGEILGHGEKIMTLSGLRAFDSKVIESLVNDYEIRKNGYK